MKKGPFCKRNLFEGEKKKIKSKLAKKHAGGLIKREKKSG